jgi:hypothetical protein
VAYSLECNLNGPRQNVIELPIYQGSMKSWGGCVISDLHLIEISAHTSSMSLRPRNGCYQMKHFLTSIFFHSELQVLLCRTRRITLPAPSTFRGHHQWTMLYVCVRILFVFQNWVTYSTKNTIQYVHLHIVHILYVCTYLYVM